MNGNGDSRRQSGTAAAATGASEQSMFRGRFLMAMTILVPCIAVLLGIINAGVRHRQALKLCVWFLKATKIVPVFDHLRRWPDPPFALFSTNVVLPSHDITSAIVVVAANGRIVSVHDSVLSILSNLPPKLVDVSPLTVMPGLIDPHVHINEPGRTSWEGFYHASRAAAAGGTTTILDMPLNNVPSTTDTDSLALKVKSIVESKPIVDIGLIGGIVPNNIDSFDSLVRGGVLALKSFMIDSQSDDFPNLSKAELRNVVKRLHDLAESATSKTDPVPYILHAELDESLTNHSHRTTETTNDHFSYTEYERSRPSTWEIDAARYITDITNNTRTHIHVAHISHVGVLDVIANAKETHGLNQVRITTETCPHYILWADEEIPRGTSLLKCAPPIRSKPNRDHLLASTLKLEGTSTPIDLVASDHSPCPLNLKSIDGNLTQSWGGISGLQYRLQGTWTAVKFHNVSLIKIVELLAEAPARVFGLSSMKGFLKPGLDADFVIWDPKDEEVLLTESCEHRHKHSPYIGMKVRGKIFQTIVRGRVVFSRGYEGDSIGKFSSVDQEGKLLVRNHVTGEILAQNAEEWESK